MKKKIIYLMWSYMTNIIENVSTHILDGFEFHAITNSIY